MLFIFQIGFPLHWTQISISTINITFIVLEWTQFQLRSKWCPHYLWLQQFCIAKTFTCVICRNSFCFSNSSAVTVAVRILRHKKNSANMTKKPSNAVKTPYSCNQCSFTSNWSRSLKISCRCTVVIILLLAHSANSPQSKVAVSHGTSKLNRKRKISVARNVLVIHRHK